MRWGQRTLQHQSIEHAYCALPPRTAQGTTPAQMIIHCPAIRERTAEYLCDSAVDYSCCFTKLPFGSTSNFESLPFALTNTS